MKRRKSDEYNDGIDIINLLDENSDKIIHWVDYALTAIKKDKRKREKFEFSGFFKSLEKSWRRIFKKKDIKLNFIDFHSLLSMGSLPLPERINC